MRLSRLREDWCYGEHVQRPIIVVGVEGSESSRYALRWAARQAECADADLRIVMAWHLPEIYSYEPRDYEAEARSALDEAVEQTLGSNPRVPVRSPGEPGLSGWLASDSQGAFVAQSRAASSSMRFKRT